MAAIASHVIMHPTASQTLKVLGTTLGRDKIYRAIQYFARFFAWYLISRGYNVEAARWTALKNHLGTGRKLMRLGKPLEHLQAALRAASVMSRPSEQITTVLRQLCYAGFIGYDHVVWANSVKFLNLEKETAAKAARRSNRFWFFGIVFSVCHGLIKAGRLANEAKEVRSPSWREKSVGGDAERTAKLAAIEKERVSVRHQFIIDILDFWIPATNLGYFNVNDGVLGIFGIISSLLALRNHWSAVNKKA